MSKLISFIIPAHNEEAQIAPTLEAIRTTAAELGLRHEVIVADDASTDATARLAAAGGARVVSIDRRQIAAARNAGAAQAGGEVLIFVDADTRVTPGAVRAALAALDAGAVGGGARIRFDGFIPFWARIVAPTFMAVLHGLNYTGGCFIYCTRKSFDAAGGWDEGFFAGEEIELAKAFKRLGKFRIIHEHVITSGRKLRAYKFGEMMWLLIRMSLSPNQAVRSRDKLDLWYAPRRADPGAK